MSARVAPDAGRRPDRVVADRPAAQHQPRSVLATQARRVLAGSGFVMLGFVVLHLAANLMAFAGSGTLNTYARSLRELGTPLVGEGVLLGLARVVLAGALGLHLMAHALLRRKPTSQPCPQAAAAGPLPPWYATLPVEWLLATGGLIAVFVTFHIAQLTIGATHPAFVPDDPYHNLVVALGFWPVSIAYIAAAVAVGAHLLPGIWTGMRSLGLIRPGTQALAGTLSAVGPLVIVVGMAAVPVAILTGVLR